MPSPTNTQHNRLSILQERAALLQGTRSFFIDQGFLEVETPVRIPAPAPEAHIEPEQSGEWYLQTSPELCMKRLLAAGHARIFQICKCFRRQERGERHLPEMTMLEWYRSNADYRDLMTDCEELLRSLTTNNVLQCHSHAIDLSPPWPRLTLHAAFQRYAPISLDQALADDCFEEILVRDIEPHLGQRTPVFLCDYPAVQASLARLQPNNPTLAERFELYINGIELANGFSELTDANEQRLRFQSEQKSISSLGRQPGPMPEPFLTDLAKLPAAAGIALGVDRLVMLFSGATHIDQV
ncbi:MAG: EF-P lysine aminoacylase EpmA, partial [Desulfobulbaceae bacterium]|nr:EF-P lysine aminoacylase EpmA [Desulfobulbaceae bacterium]